MCSNSDRKLVEEIRSLLEHGNKYIVLSLALTPFIDTTSIGLIATLFSDAKGSHIAFSQCRPDVVDAIKRFECRKEPFPENIKLFVATEDAVAYLEKVRKREMDRERTSHSTTKGDHPLYEMEESVQSLH